MFKAGSLYLGQYFGIPVKVHWSFVLLLLYVVYTGQNMGMSNLAIINSAIFTLLIFFCVVLHEFGHALSARNYGVKTQDILITPIGGLARLERLPENPWQEMVVAIAGPAVNLVIAIIIAAALYFSGHGFLPQGTSELTYFEYYSNFPILLLMLNLLLLVFNLIPAFPMDGGRILRATIALFKGREKGTLIASWVGRILAGGFLVYGIYTNHLGLIFIGVFVFFAARSEYRSVAIEERLRSGRVADILTNNVHILTEDDLMQDVFKKEDESGHDAYLVQDENNKIIGILNQEVINQARKDGDIFTPIRRYMTNNFEPVSPELPIKQLFYIFNTQTYHTLPVFGNGSFLGVVSRRDLQNFLTLKY
ncbi:site-2 protease family protein [Membranihabitans maritimus]|uniref:site-2 protease family protein n=1 Tax=Membranihabitans maritimus TaxID=2904244 RepID=UPI001F47F1EE|nr:site-2 protease family protein [Membranihabitans maritimus]